MARSPVFLQSLEFAQYKLPRLRILALRLNPPSACGTKRVQ
jgi:hypothetical protein